MKLRLILTSLLLIGTLVIRSVIFFSGRKKTGDNVPDKSRNQPAHGSVSYP